MSFQYLSVHMSKYFLTHIIDADVTMSLKFIIFISTFAIRLFNKNSFHFFLSVLTLQINTYTTYLPVFWDIN